MARLASIALLMACANLAVAQAPGTAASKNPTDADAAKGKANFEKKCAACHSIGEGKKVGPDLAGITRHRDDAWLRRWLKSPEEVLKTDAHAKEMLKEYGNVAMPNPNLTDAEIRQFLKYFHWYDARSGAAAPHSHGKH
jgi:nitrite reductase (NO-forming)